jgi:hypothetical protein
MVEVEGLRAAWSTKRSAITWAQVNPQYPTKVSRSEHITLGQLRQGVPHAHREAVRHGRTRARGIDDAHERPYHATIISHSLRLEYPRICSTELDVLCGKISFPSLARGV